MELLLSTHDTGYERPDGPTIAKVLASLDGGRNVVATLGTSDSSYLQATGGVQTSVLSPTDGSGRWWWERWVGARRILEQ